MPIVDSNIYVELADGRVGRFEEGGIIGRNGTMGAELFSTMRTLSRNHLSCTKREATWFITLLPEARNQTVFDSEVMRPGIAHRIVSRHSIRVGGDQFWVELGSSYQARNDELFFAGTIAGGLSSGRRAMPADSPKAAPTGIVEGIASPRYSGTDAGVSFDTPPRTVAADEVTGPPVRAGSQRNRLDLVELEKFPGARMMIDSQLMILWASDEAKELFSIRADSMPSDAFVSALHSDDKEAVAMTLEDFRLGHRAGSTSFRLRCDSEFQTFEADVSAQQEWALVTLEQNKDESDNLLTEGEDQEKMLLEQVQTRIKTMAFFSLSNAFQSGDLARSISLLTVKSFQAMNCSRVTVWLAESGSPNIMICKGNHEAQSGGESFEQKLNLDYCKDYFDRIAKTPYLASAREGDPILEILAQIGYVRPECRSVLTTGMYIGDQYFGLVSFERQEGDLTWEQSARHFALCVASYGVLAVQTQRQKVAMEELRKTGEQLVSEVQEAQNYIFRILPEKLDTDIVSTDWQFVPSEDLGGDSFGYHWLDDDNFAMYVIDVVGHGTGAALLSVSVMNTLRSNLLRHEDFLVADKVVSAINGAFQMEDQGMLTFSMWYGVYNKSRGSINYCSAGHPPALLLLEDTEDGLPNYKELETGGLMMGAIDDAEYESETVVFGNTEAKLYIFTDGAFEIPLGGDRMWSFEEFIASVRFTQHMESGEADYLLKRVQGMCRTDQLPDDFCLARFHFHRH